MSAQLVQDAEQVAAQVEPIAVKLLGDPVQRERTIAALERIGGNSLWARRIKALALGIAGVVVLIHGAVYFDGATTVIGAALITAGASEASGAL